MARRRQIVLWVGVALIIVYWLSAWWVPALARIVGLHPDSGNGLRQMPGLVRFLEAYHWPHLAAMRWLGPRLEPRDAFFPPGWVLVLTQVIPMIAMTVAWWLVVRWLDGRAKMKWPASI